MAIAEDIKKLFKGDIDGKLEVIERYTNKRLTALLQVQEVPEEFEYISYEVTLKRFNRIGQEGMQSYSQEGLSMAFPDSDFDEYTDEINKWKDNQAEEDGERKRGRFRAY